MAHPINIPSQPQICVNKSNIPQQVCGFLSDWANLTTSLKPCEAGRTQKISGTEQLHLQTENIHLNLLEWKRNLEKTAHELFPWAV